MKSFFPYDHMRGKAVKDLPQSELKLVDKKEYICSKKYDGNRIFIVKHHSTIRCFTSDWKEFELPLIGATSILSQLHKNSNSFILESEFNYTSEGKLGDRRTSAILTTFRTQFKKGCKVIDSRAEGKIQIKIFDYLEIENDELVTNVPYSARLENALMLILPKCMQVIRYSFCKGSEITRITNLQIAEGWEGCMFVEANSKYSIGKRVNYVIKSKVRPTADLLCIATEEGEVGSKYEGMIGALLLRDSKNRTVSVGSGLEDSHRLLSPGFFIGKVIEMAYEQIMDTYIQPTFVCVREDKSEKDID